MLTEICPACGQTNCPTQYVTTPKKEDLDAVDPEERGLEWLEAYAMYDHAKETCDRNRSVPDRRVVTTVVFAFGHGGGIMGPGYKGNTNFAVFNVSERDLKKTNQGLFPETKEWPDNGAVVPWLFRNHYFWLVDCGPATIARICEWNVSHQCSGVMVTHLHDDHVGGLEQLMYRNKWVDKIPNLKVCVPHQEMAEDLFDNRLNRILGYTNQPFPLSNYYIGSYYEQPDAPWPTRFVPFKVSHNTWMNGKDMLAYGYRYETPNGDILFSGDTAFPIFDENTKWDRVALAIHDVQFYNDGSENTHVHCPYGLLRDSVPPEHRHKVLLTHTDIDLPPHVVEDGFSLFRQGTFIAI